MFHSKRVASVSGPEDTKPRVKLKLAFPHSLAFLAFMKEKRSWNTKAFYPKELRLLGQT